MTIQSSSNVLVALRRETDFGTPATSGAGAHRLRIVDGQGLEMDRGQIRSGERRPNRIAAMGRLGNRSVGGTYPTELTVGGAMDLLLESIQRGEWSPALALAAVSVTNTDSVITRSSGSWLTDGLRVGDVVTPAADTVAAHNGLRLRVVAVTATELTVAGTPLTTEAVARPVDFTRLKKVVNPAVPISHSYSVEQYDADIDASELFLGVRLVGLQLSFRPNSVVQCQWTFAGVDRRLVAPESAPWYTSPLTTVGLALVADDSMIRLNGEDVTTLTGFDLQFQIENGLQPVIGSQVSPNVYDHDLTISGTVTGMRRDLSALEMWDAEQEFEFSTLLTEPGADPKPCVGLFLPRVKLGKVSAPVLGGDGAKIETRTLMVSDTPAATGYDATAAAFFSSAP